MPSSSSVAPKATPEGPVFGEVYRSHYHRLRLYASRFRAPGMSPDDLLSEAIVRALSCSRRADIIDPVAYLTRSIRNIAIDKCRANGQMVLFSDEEMMKGTEGWTSDSVEMLSTEMKEAMLSLQPRWRIILFRLLIAEESVLEVAGDMGVTPGAVRSLAHRARAGLREAYRELTIERLSAECALTMAAGQRNVALRGLARAA